MLLSSFFSLTFVIGDSRSRFLFPKKIYNFFLWLFRRQTQLYIHSYCLAVHFIFLFLHVHKITRGKAPENKFVIQKWCRREISPSFVGEKKKHSIFSHLTFILLCTFVIFTCKLFSSFCTRMNLFWLAANDVEWGGGSDEEGNMNSKSWLLIWFVLNNT